MVDIKHYSQRDPSWKGELLGFSTSTIGGFGCTITCLGNVSDLTPKEVNERMKKVEGYAASSSTPKEKNLVIWSKIQEAIPWLKFHARVTTYDDVKVKEAIQLYGFCLIEVDGAPIGGTRHWVVSIGNKTIVDPWDGQEKPFSTYVPKGYAVLELIGKKPVENANVYRGYDLTNRESMKVCVDRQVEITFGEWVRKAEVDAIIKSHVEQARKFAIEDTKKIVEGKATLIKDLATQILAS